MDASTPGVGWRGSLPSKFGQNGSHHDICSHFSCYIPKKVFF